MTVRGESRAKVLGAAVKLLCRCAVEGVGRMLSPDELARFMSTRPEAERVSRQTIYRMWGDRNVAIRELAAHVTDPESSGAKADLAAAEGVYDLAEQITADVSTEDQQELFLAVLSENFERQFGAETMAAGWILHSAALTSSPLWRGEPPDAEALEVGRELLAARGRSFEHIAEIWTGLLREAMAAFGRRPRDGYDVEDIVRVMHSTFDGSLLHIFVDPRLNDPDIGDEARDDLRARAIRDAAQAMVALAWAYSEPGSLDDPRRPDPPNPGREFEDLVDRAANLYADGHREVSPEHVASVAGVPLERVRVLFPTPSDLADSVVRRLVAPAGSSLSTAGQGMITSVLGRLEQAARTHPHAFAVAGAEAPQLPPGGEPFLRELTTSIARALPRPRGVATSAWETADDLVGRALRGDAWSGLLDNVS
jgi:hypothetical protein